MTEQISDVGGMPPQQVMDVIPARQGAFHDLFFAEWGVRVTDDALIIHIYPPTIEGDDFTDWPTDSVMDKALEAALPQTFSPDRLTAGYEPEQKSFYVIAGGYGQVLDPRMLVEKFFERLEASYAQLVGN